MIHLILKLISSAHLYMRKGYDRTLMYFYRHLFSKCGKSVYFYPNSSDFYYKHISLGNQVYIGPGASFHALISYINIGNKVSFGPNVTIRGGNHSTHIIGKFMADYQTSDKLPEDDQPVLIEDDVWVGTGAIILKGVTVGRGSIIAAGAVVTKNVAPYSIVGGVPARLLKFRWDVEKIREHEKVLYAPNERLSADYLKSLIQ